MNYPFVVLPEEDGYSIQFPDLPGANGFAETLADVGHEAETVAQLWIESMQADGDAIPEPTVNWDPIDRTGISISDLITVARAADELGISERRVRSLATSRDLGTKVGDLIVFSAEEVEAMKERRPGRPKIAVAV
ncbi:MAG: type II toxin-antitoxin system HicB family antitoxin [Thermomicrobiales bacterium]|nr:type II toxin-antitoxin system HicB family antitoxin [Thermomicrobiales bacterium]